ncbi:MAG: Glutamate-1-semialdehyde 2,1-aminomutase [Elusimicrobia bacterium]|nr:Glutamate-1-semialdehyde 2,1-aminomutase [Elusimicrobiota bacterium]
MGTSKSELLFQNAQKHLVGGVNSPVRSFKAVGGHPRFIQCAKGAYVEDVDGNRFIDFVGSWGPMILGHNPDRVIKAVKEQLDRGTSYGAPCEVEVELAQQIKEALPSIELLRFTSSGTEATMSALRLARAVTKRARILKFEGSYHGHSDGLLVSAGSGATTFGVPSSQGVPDFLAKNTWVLPYNDVEALDVLFTTQGINIAAVILEPVCGNMGVVEPSKEFLNALSKLTKEYGSLLIFDEVMTGFRLGWSGAQGLFNMKPDLTCLGKIIGGGFPVGAFGGRRELMEQIAPMGPVYQAGTLSGNPIAMSAGLATLKSLKSLKPYKTLEKITSDLAVFLRNEGKKKKIPIQVNQVGSMFTVFFTSGVVDSYLSAMESDTKAYATFFNSLLEQGVSMPPSQFEAAFVSTEHDAKVMDQAKKIFSEAFSKVARAL